MPNISNVFILFMYLILEIYLVFGSNMFIYLCFCSFIAFPNQISHQHAACSYPFYPKAKSEKKIVVVIISVSLHTTADFVCSLVKLAHTIGSALFILNSVLSSIEH